MFVHHQLRKSQIHSRPLRVISMVCREDASWSGPLPGDAALEIGRAARRAHRRLRQRVPGVRQFRKLTRDTRELVA